MPDHGDSIVVDTLGQAGDVGEDLAETINDGVQVGDAHPPDGGEAGIVKADAVAAGIKVGRLNHYEPGSRPAVDERLVAVHRPGVAVREHDHGQVTAGQGGGDLDLQVDPTVGGGDEDGLDGDDLTGDCRRGGPRRGVDVHDTHSRGPLGTARYPSLGESHST